MNLESSQSASNWLAQFDVADREVVRQLLRRLTLVSESEFDSGLQIAIESLLQKIGKENVALFSIPEPPSEFDTDGIRRVKGSSADRVKHILENLVRVHGDRVRAHPSVHSMRSDRIRNVVLVEDFIGSGDRISGYWKAGLEAADKSVKSWLSYGWTKIWVVSYAAIDAGVTHLRVTIPKLSEDRIVTVLPIQKPRSHLSGPMQIVAEKYGSKLRRCMPLGYSGGGGTVIFQHGCPNNAPAILWAYGRRFKPLFPDRGIPTDIQVYFGQPNLLADAEELWDHGQYRLALALIDHVAEKKKGAMEEWGLILALAFASRRGGWDDTELQGRLELPIGKIVDLRRRAYSMSLIDKQDHRVTPFGKELLSRLRKSKVTSKKASIPLPKLSDLYYPDTCEGVSKH